MDLQCLIKHCWSAFYIQDFCEFSRGWLSAHIHPSEALLQEIEQDYFFLLKNEITPLHGLKPKPTHFWPALILWDVTSGFIMLPWY